MLRAIAESDFALRALSALSDQPEPPVLGLGVVAMVRRSSRRYLSVSSFAYFA